MKKIGIFLGFNKDVNLTNEGIGRLLSFLLKENENNKDTKFVIYSPKWLLEKIENMCEDQKIDQESFDIVTTKDIPFGIKLREIIQKRKIKAERRSKLKQLLLQGKMKILNIGKVALLNYIGTSSLFSLTIKSVLYILLGIILLPLGILFGLLYIFMLSLSFIKNLTLRLAKKFLYSSLVQRIKIHLKSGNEGAYQLILDKELDRVVKLINMNTSMEIIYVPSLVWSQISNLKCKVVLAAPDIVFYDFPTQFYELKNVHKRIRKSIDSADHLICYSDFVKINHLVGKCGIDSNKITVIKHANVDMMKHLKISKGAKKYVSHQRNTQEIVQNYLFETLPLTHIINNCNISDMDFVIFSSQDRPHKNILALIKAIKILNKDMYMNIKLILTGVTILYNPKLFGYIEENNLQNDVFVLPNLSSEVLAAFNAQAKCAVNPTLFEGGFPFTFSEAYSVGTPSVMSDIPVTRAELTDELADIMLFDPYNPYKMADKIKWAIENRDELYNIQRQLYEKFDQRDWKVVAKEYNDVFVKNMK